MKADIGTKLTVPYSKSIWHQLKNSVKSVETFLKKMANGLAPFWPFSALLASSLHSDPLGVLLAAQCPCGHSVTCQRILAGQRPSGYSHALTLLVSPPDTWLSRTNCAAIVYRRSAIVPQDANQSGEFWSARWAPCSFEIHEQPHTEYRAARKT